MTPKTETISVFFHVREDALSDEDRAFIIDWAMKIRDAKNRVSRCFYKSNELKRAITYGKLKGNGIYKPFARLRQVCNATAFQKGVEQVVANFLARLEHIEYHASKDEQRANPQMVLVKSKLVKVWADTKEAMVKALRDEAKYSSGARQQFLGECVNMLLRDEGLFALIQKYQQRYLNGLHTAQYKSLTFSADNMLGVDAHFFERTDERSALLRLKFPKIIRKVKTRYRNSKTWARVTKTKWLTMQDERVIEIPVSYSEEYHGSAGDYADAKIMATRDKGTATERVVHFRNERFYQFVFNENFGSAKRQTFRIAVTKEREKRRAATELPTNANEFAGVDANFRDNALKLDDGWEYRWSDGLLKDLKNFLAALASRNQNIASNGNAKTSEWNKGMKRKASHIRKRAEAEQNLAAFLLVQHLKETGKKVLAAEDIEVNGWRLDKGKVDDDLKNKTVKQLLRFGNWKHVLERACKKAGIVFALVNSHYTSKTCAECGTIDDESRPFNEKTHKKDIFRCTRCGHETHPDMNAARVIASRMANPKIRARLQWLNKRKERWEGTKHQSKEFYQKVYREA